MRFGALASLVEFCSMSMSLSGAAPGGPSVRRPDRAVLVALASTAAVLGLLFAGVTSLAFAIAFPIAVPLARSAGIPVSAEDLATATHLADLQWLFLALTVAFFAAAVAVAVRSVRALSPTD